ncbi:Rho GTPase activation protein [Lineolata rhizophorae]|uniref:Rho GTPase activation protein n=1 Tax=Lineolata rhizophorae TaxID=578093 RepID=A0A6A6NY87_9PEZI|nr:Rho GTPase activation protein [Lineolata rhizophorae]
MASDAASVPVGNVSGSVDDSAIRNGSVKSQSVPHINSDLGTTGSNRKTVRPNKFNLLRSRSIRHEQSHHTRQKPSTPHRMLDPAEIKPSKYTPDMAGMKTAPLEKDRSFRDLIGSGIRGRSADRHQAVDSEDDTSTSLKDRKDPFSFSSSFKESGGAAFLSNIRSQGTKAADGIGKAGKGIFGKLARSGSSHEREAMPLPENYVCKVINLPLVEQTRKTRISKRLEASKDKTEFWMPALPWRCIDYLNMKGCEEEGLYRVPGSGKEIKNWQMRFDTEYDINLFDEPELYDINIIGSMFKAWLRDLPDEIFPKTTQHRIAEECAGAKETPQMLKDELSKLPPYHYYLLFAITCHISLLHSCSESNKMNYQNLCICFQPCMKIDAFCFQFLVLDWRNCWQGCWTEKTYLAEELRIMADHENRTGSPAPSHGTRMTNGTNVEDSRAVSSSESSKHSLTGSSTPDRSRHGGTGHSTQKSSHDESVTPTPGDQQPKKAEDAPKLSPVPLYSPMSVPAFAGSDDGY